MQSLALMVAIILAIAVVGGPIAVALSFLPQRAAKVAAVVFAVASIGYSVLLLIKGVTWSARFFGLFGLATSGYALWRVATAKRRVVTWNPPQPPR